MARTRKDLEAYLQAIGRPYECSEDGTYLLAPTGEGTPVIGVRADDPVVFSVQIGDAPQGNPAVEAGLFRRLLELNASDLLYASYGMRGGRIVLSAAHELENLDLNEVQAIIGDIDLALARHMKELLALSTGQSALGVNMGVFARLAQLIKANLNDLISRAEDPQKMLNQVILEMNAQLVNAKKQVAVAIADEKSLQKKLEQEQANAAEWERRAMLAVRQGDDGLAKEALARKKQHSELVKSYEEQWQKQKAAVDQLKQALKILNDKIEDAKRKKNLLEARIQRAKATKAIQETMVGIKDSSAFQVFTELEQKVDRIEAEAEAGIEMAEEATGDQLAQKFKDLEATGGVDDDLLAMKRRMGMAPPAPEPTPREQVRVKAPATPTAPPASSQNLESMDELSKALEEIQEEEQRERERLKR